jgi:hypothetical protein
MDEREAQHIELACRRLSILYAHMVDFKTYELVNDIFSEDAFLDAGGPLDGRDRIRRGMERRNPKLRSRHVLTNIFVDVLDATHALGTSYLSLYRHIGDESLEDKPIEFVGPAAVGEYEDEFVQTAEGWRIARRVLHMQFIRPAAFPR